MAKMEIRIRWDRIAFWGIQLVVFGALYGIALHRFASEGQ